VYRTPRRLYALCLDGCTRTGFAASAIPKRPAALGITLARRR
jgi:hypothetical protein